MPKYIKIKEPYENTIKIMEVHHEEQDCYVCEYKYSDILLSASKDWVIDQSDTIEKLCDGFYIDKCKEEFLYDEIFDECWYDFNPYFKECAKNGIDVYGFIKTDKGLIYVAKMNSEGVLCLI